VSERDGSEDGSASEERERRDGGETPASETGRQAEQAEPSDEAGDGGSDDGRRRRFPVVALGASAGGLHALEDFFENLPSDTGMAFVVVTHMHEGQPSVLDDLLGRKTDMPVEFVEETTLVQPDHVYVPTPGQNLALLGGALQPMDPPEEMPHPLPIDYFLRSLAQDQRERGIAIIFSGSGSDGAIGIEEVKAELGMVMAQREETAEYADMPRSAIATGMVDYVLAPKEMPEQLLAYSEDAYGAKPGRELSEREPARGPLQKLLVLLRDRTGYDFSQYKPNTIRRRIARRLHVHHYDYVEPYVGYLKEHPAELDALFKELLIGVTSFFRDPEAWEALAPQLEELLADAPEGHVLRAWVVGCSTGEEAYSLAILLREVLETVGGHRGAQIFATDIDPEAIEKARAGRYPPGIVHDVSAERLQRFFVEDDGGYHVGKRIREMVVFAPQNVISDPPFTKLDLVSCRNLLIYLERDLQEKLVPLLHYALRTDGLLFLGSSESVGHFSSELFEPLDRKARVYRRLESAGGRRRPPAPAAENRKSAPPEAARKPRRERPREAGDPVEKLLLEELVPPAVLVRENGELIHVHGRTGAFLEPAPGPQPNANVFKMAREGLPAELDSGIRKASREGQALRRRVRVRTNGEHVLVDVRIRKVDEPERYRGLFLIAFESARAATEEPEATDEEPQTPATRRRVAELEQELGEARESHQATMEELETTNEEFKSTNEELQSTNEELQSSNEELETSKEETQSLNEELQTVNSELQEKVEQLSRANDDMRNLLNGTDIATVFLDDQLRIKRYTERAKQVIRLIRADVGRHIGDIASRLHYDHLVEDAEEVLRTLVYKEAEIQGEEDRWYQMRVLPYRTTDNVIAGLVVTFVDITATKELQQRERRLLQALEGSPTIAFEQDRELRYAWLSSPAFGRPSDELIGKTDREVLGGPDLDALVEHKRGVMDGSPAERRKFRLTVQGKPHTYDVHLEPARDEDGTVTGVCGVATDVTRVTRDVEE
jgi:two-component system CheB/CheR fusion protein